MLCKLWRTARGSRWLPQDALEDREISWVNDSIAVKVRITDVAQTIRIGIPLNMTTSIRNQWAVSFINTVILLVQYPFIVVIIRDYYRIDCSRCAHRV